MSQRKSEERNFMRRTMLISGFVVVILIILIALLATQIGPLAIFIEFIGPVIWGILGILLSTLLYIGLVTLFANLREWYGETASWFEVISLWIVVVVVAGVGFGLLAGFLTAFLCIGVVYYISLIQD